MMKRSFQCSKLPALLLAGLFLAAASQAVWGQLTALGTWEFDPERRQVYVDSVRASQRDNTMSEIASQMGMARMENSIFELGVDGKGPFLATKDKATRTKELAYVTVKRENGQLVLKESSTGRVFRMRAVDRNHITLIDEAKKLIIPLRRL